MEIKYEEIDKYSSTKVFVLYTMIYEFIYIGLWVIPTKIQITKWDSITVILLNAVLLYHVNKYFNNYKNIIKPLFEKQDPNNNFINKVNKYRKAVTYSVMVQITILNFISILFLINLFDNNFFVTVHDQLKYISLSTVVPAVMLYFQSETYLDDIYWKHYPDEYKKYMSRVLKKINLNKLYEEKYLNKLYEEKFKDIKKSTLIIPISLVTIFLILTIFKKISWSVFGLVIISFYTKVLSSVKMNFED